MRIQAVQDVDHATSSRFSRGPETFVIVKVEDTIKARTKATRSDRWQDETFNLDIDKANEVELTVYDKAGDRPTPIGMLWLRISDIAEEMRRKKIETEINASGWVSADKMGPGIGPGQTTPAAPVGSSQYGASAGYSNPGPEGQTGATGGPLMIDAWFALEPVGRIHISMSFGNFIRLTNFDSHANMPSSQALEGPTTVRHRSQPSRCGPTEEGGSTREARSQVRHAAIL